MNNPAQANPATPTKNNNGIVAAIIFATVAISGSLVFLGFSMQNPTIDQIANTTDNDPYQTYLKYREKYDATITDLSPEEYEPVNKTDILRGNEDALITVIEYSDFECPFCKSFHPSAQTVVEQSNGEVNWVYRHFPLSFHDPEATNAALATECVQDLSDNETTFTYIDTLFEEGPGHSKEDLIRIAGKLGIDEQKLTTCYDNQELIDEIEADKAQVTKSYITGTPGLVFINNDTNEAIRIAAALSPEQLQSIVDQMKDPNTESSQ